MIVRKAKFIFILGTGVVLGAGTMWAGNNVTNIWHQFFPEKVEAQTEEKPEEPIKYYKERLSNEDLGKVQEISLLFTYGKAYSVSEHIDLVKLAYDGETDDPNAIKKGYKTTVNWLDKKWRERAILFDVNSLTLMGYYTNGFGIDDLRYNPGNKTLYVKPPQLQMAVLTDYSNTHPSEGLVTSMFNPVEISEIDAYHKRTKDRIVKKFSTKEQREAAYELTNKDLEKKLLHNKNLSIDVEHVVFEENRQKINVINDALELHELATFKNVKNNDPMEVLKKQEEAKKKKEEAKDK
ncbi:hypothetical protein [Priestia megaterium]|uniref:Uncharacterized protein n=1 Tax=Priestia megaterium TaxID=1404 RepID=A0A6M6E181_PRIMG|nr:hypothetical protein [Priestia megaterium]QJX80811.1 hypothetical protein FDZ14_32495 [Priestia megaterium]